MPPPVSRTSSRTSDIILLLVNSGFIASSYCYSREMKRAMERHSAGAPFHPRGPSFMRLDERAIR